MHTICWTARELSVQEDAEACGYANRAHFARRIGAAVGVNPSELRGR
ncbi:hypothetical protein ABMY26_20455 [Azospirillum sp. HJ39]